MEDRWGTTSEGAADRLAALRNPVPAGRDSVPSGATRKKLSRELILGVVLLLLGAFVVLIFVGRSQPMPVVVPATASVPHESTDEGVMKGKALFSAFVEQGNYPPELSQGDPVAIILTPQSMSDGVTRLLAETAEVASIHESTGGSFGAVITLLTTETTARDIADAGSVHLAIVPGQD